MTDPTVQVLSQEIRRLVEAIEALSGCLDRAGRFEPERQGSALPWQSEEPPVPHDVGGSDLSESSVRVLELVMQGYEIGHIARALHMPLKETRLRISEIHAALGASSPGDVSTLAVRAGLFLPKQAP